MKHLIISRTVKPFVLILTLLISVGISAQIPQYDKYGGRLDLKINNGNGFFQLGKIGNKDFLVTPEGNAFCAIGINHTHMIPTDNYNEIVNGLKSLGFNSGDYQGPVWMWKRIPYSKGIQLLETSTWLAEDQFKFEDVFDAGFLAVLETKIKNIVQPQANNKMLICYFLTDVPVWEIEKYGKSWLNFYKSLDQNSTGGQEWSRWKSENPDASETEFIPNIARQLYEKATGFIRKYDNNHLIFSDRYIEYHFPENIVYECLPFVDGIAIQPKNFLNFDFFDMVYEKYKKPIFVADHVTSYATNEYSNTMGQVAQNAEDYLEYYSNSVYNTIAKPYIVGYNKCQYMDQVNGTQLKQGLYRTNGQPYEYVDQLAQVHERALKNAYFVPEKKMSDQLQNWGIYEDIKQEAVQRIIENRMGNVHLKIVLPNNQLASNTEVNVKLKRHDFKWGAVVAKSFVTSTYSDTYKEIFLKYFNASGFNIALKPKHRNTATEEIAATQTMPWFLENDIYVRGHALTWEGESFMRPEDNATLNDTSMSDKEKGDKLLNSMGIHFTHSIPKWDVKCWDVTNEPIANNDINNLFPNFDTHAYWFKLADSIRRANNKEDVLLFENDYQIISAISLWALNRPAKYREIIDNHIALGAPVEGIGFQSRIKHGLITPDTIYNRLCDFERYNLPYHATEFEIRDDQTKYVYTDQERRFITEYMMIMYFSHPNVKGFWHWTFADRNPNDPLDFPLFNYNGTPKINGQIWMDLMDGFFSTKDTLVTNSTGEADVFGYFGNYEVETEINGSVLTGTFDIDSTNTAPVIMVQLKGNVGTSLKPDVKKKTRDVQIRQNLIHSCVDVFTGLALTETNRLEIAFFDIYGRKLFQIQLNQPKTSIPMINIPGKGLSVAVIQDSATGRKVATEKIILM